MHVRVLALALLLSVGAACAHTRSEESAQTRSTDRSQTATSQQGQAERDRVAGTAATPPSDQNRTQAGSDPSSERSSTDIARSGSAAGTAAAGTDVTKDPIMEPGEATKGHADDQVVSGTLSRITRRTVVIDADTGDQRTLYLAPETSIQIDGQDAQRTDLQQGQDVRASFSDVDGRDIAVEIHAGKDAASPGTRDEGPGSAIQTDDPSNKSGSGTVTQPPSER